MLINCLHVFIFGLHSSKNQYLLALKKSSRIVLVETAGDLQVGHT